MKKLAFAVFVACLAMVVVMGTDMSVIAATPCPDSDPIIIPIRVSAPSDGLPVMENFTYHIKADGYPEIGFSYKPAVTNTQRMILCVPKTGSPSTLIPTPWITGPSISKADIADVKETYDTNKACFACAEANKAANGCQDVLWKESPPTGGAPTLNIQ